MLSVWPTSDVINEKVVGYSYVTIFKLLSFQVHFSLASVAPRNTGVREWAKKILIRKFLIRDTHPAASLWYYAETNALNRVIICNAAISLYFGSSGFFRFRLHLHEVKKVSHVRPMAVNRWQMDRKDKKSSSVLSGDSTSLVIMAKDR